MHCVSNTYSNLGAQKQGFYRHIFHYNGQENDNEVSGPGNTTTALFWEYDTRTGRRWNLDPISRDWESSYATFLNCPISADDPDGLEPSDHYPGDHKHRSTSGHKVKHIKRKSTENDKKSHVDVSHSANYLLNEFANIFRSHKKPAMVKMGYYSSSNWIESTPTSFKNGGHEQTFRLTTPSGSGNFTLKSLQIVEHSYSVFHAYLVTAGSSVPTGGMGDIVASLIWGSSTFSSIEDGKYENNLDVNTLTPALGSILATYFNLTSNISDKLMTIGAWAANNYTHSPVLRHTRDYHIFAYQSSGIDYTLRFKYRQWNLYNSPVSKPRSAISRWFYGLNPK